MLFPSNLNVYRTMQEARAQAPLLDKYSLSYLVPTKGKHSTETGHFESRGMEVPELRYALVQVHSQTGRLAGTSTSGYFPQWSFDHINVCDRDEACSLDVNAVIHLPGIGPVMWGHYLKGSEITLPEVVVSHDLLLSMVESCRKGKDYNLNREAHIVCSLINRAIQDLEYKTALRSGSCNVYHDQGYPWLNLTFEVFHSTYEFNIRPGVKYAVAQGSNAAELLQALPVLYPQVCKYDESKRYVQINGYWIGIY